MATKGSIGTRGILETGGSGNGFGTTSIGLSLGNDIGELRSLYGDAIRAKNSIVLGLSLSWKNELILTRKNPFRNSIYIDHSSTELS